MYVKFRNFHLNVLKIPKFSPKARHQNYEKFLYEHRIPKNNFHNVRKNPLEFNSSYTLKPSCEPPGHDVLIVVAVDVHGIERDRNI